MDEEQQGKPLVTVQYSRYADTYKVPAMNVNLWLSVEAYPFVTWGTTRVNVDFSTVEAIEVASGRWRRAYRNWQPVDLGIRATLPEDDLLVADYVTAVHKLEAPATKEG